MTEELKANCEEMVLQYLRESLENMSFGEFCIKVTMHEGRPTKCETSQCKNIVEKRMQARINERGTVSKAKVLMHG